MGYRGIDNSVAVEFDTWLNVESWADDPSQSHVAIDIDGFVLHEPGVPYADIINPELDDGDLWYAWIDYDMGTMDVRLSLDGIRPADPILSRDLDIPTVLGQNTAYIGFTSGTGEAYANHDVLYWRYEVIPEPNTLSLLAVGTLVLLRRRR